MKQSIVNFVSDVGSEMRKVSWPGREQLWESTLVTISVCVIISIFVFIVDWIFTQLFGLIF